MRSWKWSCHWSAVWTLFTTCPCRSPTLPKLPALIQQTGLLETQTQLSSVWNEKCEPVTHPQVWVAYLKITETLQTQSSSWPLLVQTPVGPLPRRYKHYVTLILYERNGTTALQVKSHWGQCERWACPISPLFYPGLCQWKPGSWHCRWKLRSGARIFNPVIIDSSKAGTADVLRRTHCAVFMSSTPSNHCL